MVIAQLHLVLLYELLQSLNLLAFLIQLVDSLVALLVEVDEVDVLVLKLLHGQGVFGF